MGPKSRISKNSWELCDLCRAYFPATEVSKHVRQYHGENQQTEEVVTPCRTRLAFDVSPMKTPVKSWTDRESSLGFVRDFILHGFAAGRRTKIDELSRLPASAVDDVVLICPSTMTLCKMSIGSPLLVWSSPTVFAIQIAWPAPSNSGIGPTEVNLSERTLRILSCELGEQIHAQSYKPSEVAPAFEVILETSDAESFMDTKEFADSFRHTFDGKYVVQGARLITHFYGKQCQLIVFAVKSTNLTCDSEPLMNSDSANWTLCDDISTLTLNSKKEFPTNDLGSFDQCNCRETRPSSKQVDFCFYVHSDTRVRISTKSSGDDVEINRSVTTFDDIGGLTKQIDEIKRFIAFSKSNVQTFFSYGLEPPKGIVLYGPPGTGKTLIGRAIAHAMPHNFLSINGPEIFSKFLGETESRLRDLFAEANERAPCVIFIDEIDTLCGKRNSSSTHQEQRVTAMLTTLMDNLPTKFNERVVVIAATNKVDDIDSSVRRPGRFDREIEIGIPSVPDRQQILTKLLRNARHNMNQEDMEKVAAITHGFVGADLAALCSQAGMCALKRIEGTDADALLTFGDIMLATNEIKPSALREVLIEVPKVYWNDVGGQDDLKRKLKQAVEWPLRYPESFKRMGITPPKGVLMYGPPGCSKTMIAKAVATESGLNFIAIKGPELFSKWVGESEKAIREVFRKARAASPSVVFFDEIDALASERGNSTGGSQVGDRVLAQLLSEMDGLQKLQGVFILAATNRPDMIDKALLRPGRLDRIVYVPLPDKKTRREIFSIQMKRIPVADDVDLELLVNKTDNYSGAEVVAVCQEAALNALEHSLEAMHVVSSNFEHALHVVKPRISKKMIRFYEEYNARGKQKTDL